MNEITQRETIYEGKLLSLETVKVRGKDGEERARDVVRHKPGVTILALREESDAVAQGYQVVMVQQYRPPLEQELLELVAGIIDEGETPLEAAQRELREETGLVAEEWVELGTIVSSPGFTDERITIFLARTLQQVGADPDPEENLSICTMPFTLLMQDLLAGKIQDAKTVAGLLWLSVYLSQ
jgi:ADP-ribose pyrophosphatase